ncbi:MurR/RpiR family transcriptional regulator [Deinococcus sp.]|uniref:MurR/RpiR family transcriptional regulator n=1 Tax=Deinococcus sp. TaxID=47478 RepID=UPI002869A0B6|nr:MurR/RpiR family transcriptional regulator [Deinococcus sp.]
MSTMLTDRLGLMALLDAEIPTLSGAQRRLALYLRERPEHVSFMTTTDFAQAAGTSQSSVTRFALRLGFDNYASFSKVLSSVVLNEIHTRAPAERFRQQEGGSHLSDFIRQEMGHLKGLVDVLDTPAFARSVERLANAQRIIVAGFAAAASTAEHAGLYFSRLHPHVHCVTSLQASLLTHLTHWTPQDTALLFTAPRLTNDAVLFADLLRQRGVPVVLVADPASLVSGNGVMETLIVPVTLGLTTAIPAAMLMLASLLVDAVALKQAGRTSGALQTFEELSAASSLFVKDRASAEASWEEHLKILRGAPDGAR